LCDENSHGRERENGRREEKRKIGCVRGGEKKELRWKEFARASKARSQAGRQADEKSLGTVTSLRELFLLSE